MGSEHKADHARYVELIGITPDQFEILVGVMTHQLVYGSGVSRKRLTFLLKKKHDVNASGLIRRGLLTTEGELTLHQRLLATDRAWREFWPERELLVA